MDRFPYQVVVRLVQWAAVNWTIIDGGLARVDVDLMKLPIRRFLAAIYTMLLDTMKPDDRERFVTELYEPMPGFETREATREIIDDEMAVFKAAAARRGRVK